MLTRRGQAVVALAVALVVSAGLFGVEELYPLAAAAGALVLACGLWVRLRQWNLATARQLRPAQVPAGAEARVELAVTNRSLRRSPVVTAGDPFDGGRRWAEFALAPLEPGETTRAAYRLPTTRRGRYPVGPLRMELSDPFGLFSNARPGGDASILTVHPPVIPIRSLTTSTGSDRQDAAGSAVVGRAGDEFYGVREYRPGDDLRRVHWPTTARTGELMIRQDEIAWSGRLTVVTDARETSHLAESLETTLSIAASVAASGCAARLRVRLVTTSGGDSGFGASPAHLSAILDQLAAVSPHQDREGVSLLALTERTSAGGAVVLITTTAAGAEELAGISRLSGTAEPTLVVVERARGLDLRRRGMRLPGVRMVRVSGLDTFAPAWNVAVGHAPASLRSR